MWDIHTKNDVITLTERFQNLTNLITQELSSRDALEQDDSQKENNTDDFECSGEVLLPVTRLLKIIHSILTILLMVDIIDVSLYATGLTWYEDSYLPHLLVYSFTNTMCGLVEVYLNREFNNNLSVSLHGLFDQEENWKETMATVLSTIPLDGVMLLNSYYNYKCFKIIRMCRIYTASSKRYFREASPLASKSKKIQALQLSVIVLCTIQVLSVVWLSLCRQDLREPSMTDGEYYISGVYFIITTLTTVGYGDIQPVTLQELWFIIWLQVASSIIIFIIAAKGTIFFVEQEPYESACTIKKKQMVSLFSISGLPFEIQKQCFALLPTLLQKPDFSDVLEHLPEFVRNRLDFHIKFRMVNAVPLFKSLPKGPVAILIKNLTTEVYGPKEYIIRVSEKGGCMHFISSGMVEVTNGSGESEQLLATLGPGAWFGEVALLYPFVRRTASVRSVTVTEVFVLKRECLDQLDNASLKELRAKLTRDRRSIVATSKRRQAETNSEDESNCDFDDACGSFRAYDFDQTSGRGFTTFYRDENIRQSVSTMDGSDLSTQAITFSNAMSSNGKQRSCDNSSNT